MGFRFRKSFKLGKGFKVNLSKSGVGYSFGTKGLRFTKSATGKSRSTMSIPGTGISYTSSSGRTRAKEKKTSTKNSSTFSRSSAVMPEKTTPMKWTDFFICLGLGFWGVHKFRERKIGLGILYIFTFGLFLVGWIIDTIRYLVIAIKSLNANPPSTDTPTDVDSSEISLDSKPSSSVEKPIPLFAKILRWILVSILSMLILATIPSVFGLLALVVISLIIPITPWQVLLNKFIKRGIRYTIAGVLAFISLFTFPTSPEQPLPDVSEATLPITIIETEPVHVHTFIDATCVSAKVCTECGETEGEALGHTWIEATCLHSKYCSVCNVTEGDLADHTWQEATCLTPKTCTICAHTEGEPGDHTWQDATCIVPKTCSVCNQTEGSPTDHTWISATCQTPKTCSVCNATTGKLSDHTWEKATCQTPKTCSVCGTTKGNPANHTWENATCQTRKTCSVCGEETGELIDCKYKNGECIYCGDSEPTVWIPKSGSKYHSNEFCSNMNDPSEVTLSTAKARGFTPCKRCY